MARQPRDDSGPRLIGMDLSELRVGYAPYSADLTRPGDRRRFCFYARQRGIEFEFADPRETYDLVVLSARADITDWSRYRAPGAKIIYDLIDSYLAVPRRSPRSLGRGLAKFAARETRRLALDYRSAMRAMCERADAVVCTTIEQRAMIEPLCDNVHEILDWQQHLVRETKTDYATGEVFNLVWEGLPDNLGAFRELRGALAQVRREQPVAMHLVTDLEFRRYAGRFRRVPTEAIAAELFDDFQLHEWNEQALSATISACDLALIPLSLADPLAAGKPENKLLLFWRLGVPALCSATPAYVRAVEASGSGAACRSTDDWVAQLRRFMSDEEARREAGRRGREFAERHHGEAQLLARWDRLMESVLS